MATLSCTVKGMKCLATLKGGDTPEALYALSSNEIFADSGWTVSASWDDKRGGMQDWRWDGRIWCPVHEDEAYE